MMFFDAHLDLAMNAIEWNRDLTRPLSDIRQREAHLQDKPDRGRGTVCLPELRRGGFQLVVGTQIARVEHNAYSPVFGWSSPAQAWAMTQAQRAWYRAMEEAGEMTLVHDRASLDRVLAQPSSPHTPSPVGLILSLEGADSLVTLAHLERSYADGLRAIGPAHYGPGVYANGTNATGGFNARGRELLREIERLGLILDVTHLCDDCFHEALDLFHGTLWASHHNSRTLVPHDRQLSDEMIRLLVQRQAVIGVALDAWMLVPGWVRGQTTPASSGVRLTHVADHIDHVCQIAGNAQHVGIGSDLDGAFGTEQTPGDLDTIADLARLPDILRSRGYSDADLEAIASGNLLRTLRRAWK
ncbi:MAG: membrane dipeptidase [Verrucomicrobiales bacterium]|nr:membrane dipeptidase [Verrucomicrobiales bacterium]